MNNLNSIYIQKQLYEQIVIIDTWTNVIVVENVWNHALWAHFQMVQKKGISETHVERHFDMEEEYVQPGKSKERLLILSAFFPPSQDLHSLIFPSFFTNYLASLLTLWEIIHLIEITVSKIANCKKQLRRHKEPAR